MISPRAISTIEQLFENALFENANTGGKDKVVLQAVREDDPAAGKAPVHLTVLGISSYLFRIVTLFEFAADPATTSFFGKRIGTAQRLDDSALQDASSEFVNMVCGTVNRSVQTVFPHTGISTPIVLESGCANYLEALRPIRRQSYEVDIDGALHFRLTLCICVVSGSSLDFHVIPQSSANGSVGELEFF